MLEDDKPPLNWFPLHPSDELSDFASLTSSQYGLFCRLRWLLMRTAGRHLPLDTRLLRKKLKLTNLDSHWTRDFHELLSHNWLIPAEDNATFYCPFDIERMQVSDKRSAAARDALLGRWKKRQTSAKPAPDQTPAKNKPTPFQMYGSQKDANLMDKEQAFPSGSPSGSTSGNTSVRTYKSIPIIPSFFDQKPQKRSQNFQSELYVGSVAEEDYGWFCTKCDSWRTGILKRCKYCDEPMPENAIHYVKHWCAKCERFELYDCPEELRKTNGDLDGI